MTKFRGKLLCVVIMLAIGVIAYFIDNNCATHKIVKIGDKYCVVYKDKDGIITATECIR